MPVAIFVIPSCKEDDVDEPPKTEATGREKFQHAKTDGSCIKPVNAEEAEHDGEHEGDDPILLGHDVGLLRRNGHRLGLGRIDGNWRRLHG